MNKNLAEAIESTTEKFRLAPDDADVVFSADSTLRDGLRCDVTVRDHALVVDEPPQLGGGDAGPNPVELLLAALGTCQEITYKAYATALGIDLRRVTVKLKGDIDLRGFLSINDAVRPGFHRIRGTVELDTDASAEDIAKLKQVVDSHCPVLDMLSTPVPIELELEQ